MVDWDGDLTCSIERRGEVVYSLLWVHFGGRRTEPTGFLQQSLFDGKGARLPAQAKIMVNLVWIYGNRSAEIVGDLDLARHVSDIAA